MATKKTTRKKNKSLGPAPVVRLAMDAEEWEAIVQLARVGLLEMFGDNLDPDTLNFRETPGQYEAGTEFACRLNIGCFKSPYSTLLNKINDHARARAWLRRRNELHAKREASLQVVDDD